MAEPRKSGGQVKSFTCNICGTRCEVEAIPYEQSSCSRCGSNVRLRALAYLFTREVFGQPVQLYSIRALPGLQGFGLSDHPCYATPLQQKTAYTNTYYHCEPFLDIMAMNKDRYGSYDFILSSDVFEHIPPPVARAFEEAFQLLNPNGFLIVTVPSGLNEQTLEHFPGLNRYVIGSMNGEQVMINQTREGMLEIHRDLVFHGGPGETLELRVFSRKDLETTALAAGFSEVSFLDDNIAEFGIEYPGAWSRPFVARKKPFALRAEHYSKPVLKEQTGEDQIGMLAEIDRLKTSSALLEQQLKKVDSSRWVRLGRSLGLGLSK